MNREKSKAVQKNQASDLKARTKTFAVRVIKLYSALPKQTVAQVIGKQLLRSGTSVGAQYREGCRARSKAEFVSKLNSLLQELEETDYWLELLEEIGIFTKKRTASLRKETTELIAIFTASILSAKGKKS